MAGAVGPLPEFVRREAGGAPPLKYYYKIGVVGAGRRGAAIAQAVAEAGFPVVVKDVSGDLVARGLRSAVEGLRNRKLPADDVEIKCALLTGATTYGPFRNVDIAIEAVPEQLEVKRRVINELREACPGAILATTTWKFPVEETGASIGLRFNPPKLDVVPSARADAETLETAHAFVESLMGRTPWPRK